MPVFPKCITLNNKLATFSAKIIFGKKKREILYSPFETYYVQQNVCKVLQQKLFVYYPCFTIIFLIHGDHIPRNEFSMEHNFEDTSLKNS